MLKVSQCKEICYYVNFVYEESYCGCDIVQEHPYSDIASEFDEVWCSVEFRNDKEYWSFIRLQKLADEAYNRYCKRIGSTFTSEDIPF